MRGMKIGHVMLCQDLEHESFKRWFGDVGVTGLL